MILDDDPDICTMIKLMLEYYHYTVLVADSQSVAKNILADNPVDLILMDMLLSGTNGTEICQGFKKNETTSLIPILMFSAHPDAQQACLDAGADDFISKPFEMIEMLAKIRLALGQTSNNDPVANSN